MLGKNVEIFIYQRKIKQFTKGKNHANMFVLYCSKFFISIVEINFLK